MSRFSNDYLLTIWRKFIYNKPVGFYGPIAPPVPSVPSSECLRASIAARRRAADSIRISRRASCCCSSAIVGIAIGANFKIYLLRQFCSNRVHFLQYTGDTDAKKWWTRILTCEFCDFWDIFKFSKRRRAFPLRPICAIMVATKLDHMQ